MDSQGKRTLLAIALCVIITVGWMKLMQRMYPAPPPAAQVATGEGDGAAQADGRRRFADEGSTVRPADEPPSTASTDTAGLSVSDVEAMAPVVLGDDRESDRRKVFENPYRMKVVVTPIGAGVASVTLSEHRNQVPRDRKNPDHDPYELLSEVSDPVTGRSLPSFVLEQARVAEEGLAVDLDRAVWKIEKESDDLGESARLETVLRTGPVPMFRLRRTYRLEVNSHHLLIETAVENLSDKPRKVILTQRGPIGLKNDDPQRDHRWVLTAAVDESGKVTDGDRAQRAEILKLDDASKELLPGANRHTLWAALGSKYFACIVSLRPGDKDKQGWPGGLVKVIGRAFLENSPASDDLSFEEVLSTGEIAPGMAAVLVSEAFCGPKSPSLFAAMDGERQAAGRPLRHYEIVQNVDQSSCTFQFIRTAMLWLLNAAYRLVGNYGIAIIILVIIVRTILHPITKRGQVNMMRMQKSMGSLKPKLDLLQQQYKNDRAKLQEETIKLYREEGVNPAGSILGCLPMVLQMPVWIALWTTLNTNVDMRHEPFFGWIQDLSSPDALIPFKGTFTIPLLGAMMGPIHAFNLLPLIMTITMYAQQKFMQKLTKPAVPTPPKLDAEGNPVPDPMKQQQKIMNVMTLFFGFLFYNFPSGLNLYILSSNLLGMGEQYLIKKHIREKDERGEFAPRPRAGDDTTAERRGGGKPSFLERLARKAEEAKRIQSDRREAQLKKSRKQPRF